MKSEQQIEAARARLIAGTKFVSQRTGLPLHGTVLTEAEMHFMLLGAVAATAWVLGRHEHNLDNLIGAVERALGEADQCPSST